MNRTRIVRTALVVGILVSAVGTASCIRSPADAHQQAPGDARRARDHHGPVLQAAPDRDAVPRGRQDAEAPRQRDGADRRPSHAEGQTPPLGAEERAPAGVPEQLQLARAARNSQLAPFASRRWARHPLWHAFAHRRHTDRYPCRRCSACRGEHQRARGRRARADAEQGLDSRDQGPDGRTIEGGRRSCRRSGLHQRAVVRRPEPAARARLAP